MRHTNSDIWVGTEAGLYTIEPKTGRLREFMQYNKFPN